jgi:hypothetical protein
VVVFARCRKEMFHQARKIIALKNKQPPQAIHRAGKAGAGSDPLADRPLQNRTRLERERGNKKRQRIDL